MGFFTYRTSPFQGDVLPEEQMELVEEPHVRDSVSQRPIYGYDTDGLRPS